MSELRVLSYNIRALRDDADAVAAVVRACEPDVVAIQEAPRFLRWRSKRAALARMSGLVVACAYRPAGLTVFTSLGVDVVGERFRLLPKSPRLHQRAVCAIDVTVGGDVWRVASTHLSLDADERQRHLPALWSALSSYDDPGPPLVLAGDVNETPDGPVWAQLTERLQDAWSVAGTGPGHTYSAARPHKRIDGIFVDPRLEVVSCRSVDDAPGVGVASDHLPVLAVLRSRG